MDDLSLEIERLLDDGYYPPAIWQDRAEPVIATLRARLETAEAERDTYRQRMMQQDIELARVTDERGMNV